MKLIYIFILILFFSNSANSISLFDTDFYEIEFTSDNIEKDKLKKISEIKTYSIDKIFINILNNDDYILIKPKLNEDLINTFIKNIIFENEKIVENYYESKIKINFKKKKIINYLRNNKISYVEYIPQNFLTIIYENDELSKNLLSINNNHYSYLKKNYLEDNFFKIPNLDINDRYLLNFYDIENLNRNKIKIFLNKYNVSEAIIIEVKNDLKNSIKTYSVYFYYENSILEVENFITQDISLGNIFSNIKDNITNFWKLHNGIQNISLNQVSCKVKYYNLGELNKIKQKLENISIIKYFELNNLSYQNNNYNIFFYGNKKILIDLFYYNEININFENNLCKIFLK
tara:strand:+ start:2479 stop:3513 length:1035 start_codon:yes stop_codon:yes gene_type:complete